MKILVADDRDAVRESIKIVLYGHEVVLAKSAMEAFAILQEIKVDLLMADFEMPPGPPGTEVIAYAKAQGRTGKAILISAKDMQLLEPLARIAGADYVLSKPFGAREIFDAIGTLFPEKSAA